MAIVSVNPIQFFLWVQRVTTIQSSWQNVSTELLNMHVSLAFKDSNGESSINGQNIPNSVLANTEPGNTNGANSFDETEYGKTLDNPGKPESVMNPPGRTADFS